MEKLTFKIIWPFILCFVLGFLVNTFITFFSFEDSNPDPDVEGYVSNRSTAIAIADAVLRPIYGGNLIEKYDVTLSNDSIWIVQGRVPILFFGGGSYIEIQKKDGKILDVTHYK